MIFTVDDLCLEYLDNFSILDDIRCNFPEFKLIAFTISNFKNRENLKNSSEFLEWFIDHKSWVEIAVHSFDHVYPPDGDRDDQELWIRKARDELRDFLPEKYGYRSPGWQTTSQTEPILKKLGFYYIAYETKIKTLTDGKIIPEIIINSHLYDIKSLRGIYEILQNNAS